MNLKAATQACIDAYVEWMGAAPIKDAMVKVRSIAIRNGGPTCFYCGIRFGCADDAELEHVGGDGAKIRESVDSRKEARKIVAGTHPNPESVVYACSSCNKLKRTMTADEWYASTQYAAQVRRAKAVNAA